MSEGSRSRKTNFPSPEEELGIDHSECHERGWENCALCRSTRLGSQTLRKAKERQIQWPRGNTSLNNLISNPVPPTTLDDAFDSLIQSLSTVSRKCHNYHCCHDNVTGQDSNAERHRLRYHAEFNPRIEPSFLSLQQEPRMIVNALPGNYRVMAARWEPQATPTTRVVTLDPEKSVTVTMTV